MSATGPVYTTTVRRNGQLQTIRVAANGQILPAATPSVGLGAPGQTAALPGVRPDPGTETPSLPGVTPRDGILAQGDARSQLGPLEGVQAGLPVSTLPAAVQAGIQSQLGSAQVQTVSRDDIAGGTIYRVTALQNGRPMEYQFGANGALLRVSPIRPGVATSTVAPGGIAVPGTAVVLDNLPEAVRSTILTQAGTNGVRRVFRQQTAAGPAYWVAYDSNGRLARMLIDEQGNVLRTDSNRVAEQPALTSTPVTLDQLPGSVAEQLRSEAPMANILSLHRDERPAGAVYRVTFRNEEGWAELVIGEDGRILRDSREVPVVVIGDGEPLPEPVGPAEMAAPLPASVQRAIRAYASESDIRSSRLTAGEDGETLFDIVYVQNGRRNRLVVSKDGEVVRTEENVPPAAAAAEVENPVIAIGDLPPSVQNTIRRQTDNLMIEEIETRVLGGETIYRVLYETNNIPMELLVGTDGAVLYPEAGSAVTAGNRRLMPPPAEEEVPVRTLDVTDGEAEREAVGIAAAAERGAERSDQAEEEAAASVSLSDVPIPVQSTAKKLAGSAIIQSIVPKLREGSVVYEVTFSQNGRENMVLVGREGKIIQEGSLGEE